MMNRINCFALLEGEVFPGGNPTGMSYLFYYTEQIQNTKGVKITNTRDFGQILVVCLVELVSPVGHSANSVGVRASGHYSSECTHGLTI